MYNKGSLCESLRMQITDNLWRQLLKILKASCNILAVSGKVVKFIVHYLWIT